MSGEVGHFEIPADKVPRARKFYTTIFGWSASDVPGLGYTMVNTGSVDQQGMPTRPGYVGGGIVKRSKTLQHPVVTIVVDEISVVEKAIEKNGGEVVERRRAIGDGSMGYMAYFKDTEGNIMGLYEWPKR